MVNVFLTLSFVCIFNFIYQEQVDKSYVDYEKIYVSPKPTSYEVDGDLLKFTGAFSHKTGNKVLKQEAIFNYRIHTQDEKEKLLRLGPPRSLLVKGTWKEPSDGGNFYQFDYKKFLARQGIYHQFTINDLVRPNQEQFKGNVYPLDWARYDLGKYTKRLMPGKASTYANTLLFALDQDFSVEVKDGFREIGVIHLLSISGLHIQLMISMAHELLLRLNFTRKQIAGLLIIILPAYGLIAGLSVSIFRAVSQAIFLYVDVLFERPSNGLDNWSKSLMALLILKPLAIFSVAFQLSYLFSGFLILYGQSQITDPFNLNYKDNLKQSLALLIVGIFPLSYYFFEVNFLSLLANLIFIPLFSNLIFPLIVLSFLLGLFFSQVSLYQIWIRMLNHFLTLVESLVSFFKRFDFLNVTSGRLATWAYILLFISLLLFLKLVFVKAKTKPSWTILLLFLLSFSISILSNRLNPYYMVTFLDVGQGDAALICEPFSKKTILIDTGGLITFGEKADWQERKDPFSLGKDRLAPALKAFGVSKVDYVIISHPDMDHMGALLDLSKEIPVKTVISTSYTYQEDQMKKVMADLSTNKTKFIEVPIPSQWGNYQFIHPSKDFGNTNENSLVVYAKIGGRTFLFTGDMGVESEKRLVENFPKLNVDFLKVGHHGSNTSTSKKLIETYQPKVSIISVGENNRFGHPHDEVIELLKTSGTKILRTDQDGAIRYKYYLGEWPKMGRRKESLEWTKNGE